MKRKTIKWGAAIFIIAVLCGGGWFWLHRDAVKSTPGDPIITDEESLIAKLAEEDTLYGLSLPSWGILETGIYYQETAGDLDHAIEIYRTIKAPRAALAQAQYRIALCFEEKGQTSEARSILEKLVKEYPDQSEVVSLARSLLASLQTSAPGGRPPQ